MQQQDGKQQQGIRWHLRQATAARHEAVDALGSAFPLETPQGYRRFLRAHARALPAVEQGLEAAGIASLLPDWPGRARRAALEADLTVLGIAVPSALHFAPPAGPAAVLGAAYVLEGSRFGNGMLLRQVQAAGDTCASAATAYLGHKASWPAFLAQLEQQLADPALWHGAVEGALAAFACFHAALAAEQAEEPLLHA
ncbi:heme oxygenase [Pseudoroseomonas wenyumeiae]|uniref:Heme oxygenase n=1 Tax=Teichococcus wenyumeiae TaxID=2478470 RepID=A0A3A9J7Z9_9PROT|nr:biliverdin-producing heme oxygenase [Pseudoroseomonas wenyumeiae]RKK02100.1 heme oxygenase [Pseudoroseomonas wenyumeiae]RMI26521.1 heme oxygenase [Pseudoroseomonas wenyumeiae]